MKHQTIVGSAIAWGIDPFCACALPSKNEAIPQPALFCNFISTASTIESRIAMDPMPVDFLDVHSLLQNSEPRGRTPWGWYTIGLFVLLAMAGNLTASYSPVLEGVFRILGGVALGGMVAAMFYSFRRIRAEQQELEGAAELIQLRRWPYAAAMLRQILMRPARTAQFRAQALVYLTSVLSRYHRFDDAIAVQEYLLEHDLADPATAYGLRIGRALALLRQDRLFDADRAIAELRRLTGEAESGPLALVEIYRDVKTGHPAEAIELFQRRQKALRDQLGHRSADAWALVARAFDLLGRTDEARDAVAKATLLAPAIELLRRYPELEKMTDRYSPTPVPAL